MPPTRAPVKPAATETPMPATLGETLRRELGRIVLVLQGGGALGAYQLGVYEALHAAGIEPDWIIGTSIGAINASLIAGNAVENRLPRLLEFWQRVRHGGLQQGFGALPVIGGLATTWLTMAQGIPAFFAPNYPAFASAHMPLGADAAGYYSTAPLRATLADLVDFDRIGSGDIRLTVGAAHVRTGVMRYFDSRDMPVTVDHVMASGALPPAFPPIRIDGELYWDGGILSNTPVERVFDDNPRRNSLIFAVHIWNPDGAEPTTIWEVMNRQKDIQYASRAISHIDRQKQLHRLRHIIAELGKALPESARDTQEIRDLLSYGCLTHMHVVRLLAPRVTCEDHTKDIDFSPSGIAFRRQAGFDDATRMLAQAPWEQSVPEIEGLILHEVRAGIAMPPS